MKDLVLGWFSGLAIVLVLSGSAAAQQDTDTAGVVTRLQGLAVAMQDAFPGLFRKGIRSSLET